MPSPPLNVTVAQVAGFNQLTVTWTPPIPKNGVITAYTVYCNISDNTAIIETVVNGTTQAVTFSTKLNPAANYRCYVTANTSIGEGRPSLQVVVRGSNEASKLSLVLMACFSKIMAKVSSNVFLSIFMLI